MNFLKSGLQSVLGAQEPGAQPSGAETVRTQNKIVSQSGTLTISYSLLTRLSG